VEDLTPDCTAAAIEARGSLCYDSRYVTTKRPGKQRKTSPSARHKTATRHPGKAESRPKSRQKSSPVSSHGFPVEPPAPPRPEETQRHRESRQAAEAAIDAALEKKALLPILLDVSGRATYTDFIGVVSGRSDRQVDAIAENVREMMERRGWRLLGREGSGNGRWTLLDFGDVVLHVFYHPVREIYDIEGLWIDAPRIQLAVPPEAQLYQPDALYGTL
jgi:ribosome-associated protein